MTIENMQPQGDLGSGSGNGQGQSQGHRRRRRRRKNKGGSGASAQAQPATQQMQPPAQQSQPQAASNQQNNQNNQQNNQNRRKKKKKFTPKGPAQQTHQPGNTVNSPHHSKKKRQQKGPREFVGPMDHSYRVVNGNVADAPGSTIPTYGTLNNHGNGNGNYYSDNSAPPSLTAAVNGPTRIFFFIEDLFFNAKINEGSRKLGVKVEFLKGDKDSLARLTDAPEEEWPKLVVFDLNNAAAKPLTAIPKLKTKFKKSTSIIGFLSHLQGDLKLKAIEAGCDTVMPRSAFSQSLPNLLRRYGIEDDDDNYPQPM
jgi:hypothetical protein